MKRNRSKDEKNRLFLFHSYFPPGVFFSFFKRVIAWRAVHQRLGAGEYPYTAPVPTFSPPSRKPSTINHWFSLEISDLHCFFPQARIFIFFTTKRLWIYIALIGVDTFATRNSFLRSCGESEECLLQTAMVIVDWSWHLPG